MVNVSCLQQILCCCPWGAQWHVMIWYDFVCFQMWKSTFLYIIHHAHLFPAVLQQDKTKHDSSEAAEHVRPNTHLHIFIFTLTSGLGMKDSIYELHGFKLRSWTDPIVLVWIGEVVTDVKEGKGDDSKESKHSEQLPITGVCYPPRSVPLRKLYLRDVFKKTLAIFLPNQFICKWHANWNCYKFANYMYKHCLWFYSVTYWIV